MWNVQLFWSQLVMPEVLRTPRGHEIVQKHPTVLCLERNRVRRGSISIRGHWFVSTMASECHLLFGKRAESAKISLICENLWFSFFLSDVVRSPMKPSEDHHACQGSPVVGGLWVPISISRCIFVQRLRKHFVFGGMTNLFEVSFGSTELEFSILN